MSYVIALRRNMLFIYILNHVLRYEFVAPGVSGLSNMIYMLCRTSNTSVQVLV